MPVDVGGGYVGTIVGKQENHTAAISGGARSLAAPHLQTRQPAPRRLSEATAGPIGGPPAPAKGPVM